MTNHLGYLKVKSILKTRGILRMSFIEPFGIYIVKTLIRKFFQTHIFTAKCTKGFEQCY